MKALSPVSCFVNRSVLVTWLKLSMIDAGMRIVRYWSSVFMVSIYLQETSQRTMSMLHIGACDLQNTLQILKLSAFSHPRTGQNLTSNGIQRRTIQTILWKRRFEGFRYDMLSLKKVVAAALQCFCVAVDPAAIYTGGYGDSSSIQLKIPNGGAGQSGLVESE